jgi:hypothetical protein
MNEPAKIEIAPKFRHLRPDTDMSEGVASGFTWIGYKLQKWSLNHEGVNRLFLLENGSVNPNLDVIIVGKNKNVSKQYFEGVYLEGTNNPPVCFSINGDRPEPSSPKKQHATCAGCPKDAWGSGQGKGKACQDHRKLAVLLLPYMTKGILEKPLREPIYLKINPNSLKILKAYNDSLVHRNVHPAQVITRITWNPKKPWEMKFDILQPLTDAEADVVLPLVDNNPTVQNIIGGKVEIYEPEEELPAPGSKVNSGLLSAFGNDDNDTNAPQPSPFPQRPPFSQSEKISNVTDITPVKRGRGRPRKPPEEQQTAPEPEVQEPGNGGAASWDEDDSELSAAVAKLTTEKMKNMLPDK